jgi:hypothetical protein
LLAWSALVEVIAEVLDEPLELHHGFSAEADPDKQRFIRTCWPQSRTWYSDVKDLASATALNTITSSYDERPTACSRISVQGREHAQPGVVLDRTVRVSAVEA